MKIYPTHIAITGRTPFRTDRGGLERAAYNLAKGLESRGYHVYFYHLEGPLLQDTIPSYLSSDKNFSSISSREDYHKFLKDFNIELVINEDGMFETSSLFTNTGNSSIRVISVIHTSPLYEYEHLWHIATMCKTNTWIEQLKRITRILLYPRTKFRRFHSLKKHYRMLQKSGCDICLLSEKYLKNLLKTGICFSDNISYIGNPNSFIVDSSLYFRKFKEILFVGRIDNKSKQLPVLLKVWNLIYKRHPDWILTIIGDGADKENLIKRAEQLGLQNIRFKGSTDPRPFYKQASILCMTSIYEGFPMVLTEAQQFGLATIAFNSFGAASELISDGKTGFLIKPFSIREYANKLEQLMKDVHLRERMGREAQKQVTRFNISRILDQWEKLIKKETNDD